MKAPKTKFWDQGIRFECQGTGNCCTSRGSYGYVYLTLEDRRRMARFLNMRTNAFTRKFCEKTNGVLHLKHPEKDCQYLNGSKCGIYQARPTQCRTWPFWPENMNAKTWSRDVVGFCPGVGKGKRYNTQEIKNLISQDPLLNPS